MVGTGLAVQGMLAGMPEAADLCRIEVDGRVVIMVGAVALFDYEASDAGLRNLAAVTLPELGFTGRRVAEVVGITEEYVSELRGRTRREGSAALVARRGRPPALRAGELAKAKQWREDGENDTAIGRRLGVHATTVARALARVGAAGPGAGREPGQARLFQADPADPAPATQSATTAPAPTAPAPTAPAPATGGLVVPGATVAAVPDPASAVGSDADPSGRAGPAVAFSGSARIKVGFARSRYAGAMLLYGYLDGVGAEAILGCLRGAPARRYDDAGVLACATVGFALGIDTVEGAKHLRRGEAGPVVGLTAFPQLGTLRARLSALGDESDPVGLQRAFAAGMLRFDPASDPVYFVDDHFVAYTGAAPVKKGWNTKRRHAEPGRDDTLVVDARGRAVVFASAEPTGLSSTLPGVLTQLRAVTGPDAPILVGFDRGGAYPAAFSACRDADADWVTYRRAPLVTATAAPKRSWTVRDGKRITVTLADETVELKGYGPARQLTLYEHGQPVLQVLTSDMAGRGAALLWWLRARWRIENMFKYAAAHNGIDALADYRMDLSPDTRKIPNPARAAAKATLTAAEAAAISAERALVQLLNSPITPAAKNNTLPGVHRRIAVTAATHQAAKKALRAVPAKITATTLDPNATTARPRLERRGLQMVLRLLAYNAEAWLAEHFNAYLADPDEYRAILRNLLHHSGTLDYTTTHITVTLDRPDSPRIARSLQHLTDELNNLTAHLPGDPRPLTYKISGPRLSTDTQPLPEEV